MIIIKLFYKVHETNYDFIAMHFGDFNACKIIVVSHQ